MKHGKNHHMSKTKFYRIWERMKTRCDNPNFNLYHRYGGRRIRYDPRWADFVNFKDDMHPAYLEAQKKYPDEVISVDRVDNDGNYTKDNCEFKPNRMNVKHTQPLNNGHSKPVERQLEDGSWERFPSMMQAERGTGIHHGSICRTCNGKHKTAGGFIWRYAKK